ncbi:MAG: hypothetical protein LBB41_04450 [Prevotellaceae bacterium]|jgi:hypothetical protein|nr:hypothetical protein [Prevotellaceae bacterium]
MKKTLIIFLAGVVTGVTLNFNQINDLYDLFNTLDDAADATDYDFRTFARSTGAR